ncbi:MAG: transporter [Verrucomicrobia bacterium]|nr:MAG: transporter [Verrucomicrobiota bacterium]
MSARQFVGWAALAMLSPSIPALGGRPLTIDDAEPVAPRQFQIEAGVGYLGDQAITHFDFPVALTYGLLPRVEIGAGFGGQIEERKETLGAERAVTDVGDLTLGTKIKLFTAEQAWADQATALTVKLPTASCATRLGSGGTDFDLTWIVSKPITAHGSGHFNLGYTWTGNCHRGRRYNDILHYGFAADYQLAKTLQLVAEVFANTPVANAAETGVRFNGGVRWQVLESLVLDAAIGTGGLRDPAEITATVGLTWTFGLMQ